MEDKNRTSPDGTNLRLVTDEPEPADDLKAILSAPSAGSEASTLIISAIAATALVFIAYGVAKACGATLHGRELTALAAVGALFIGTGIAAFAPRFSMKPFLWALSSACAFTGVCWVIFSATSNGTFLVAGFVLMLAATIAALIKDADQAATFNVMIGTFLGQIMLITLFLRP